MGAPPPPTSASPRPKSASSLGSGSSRDYSPERSRRGAPPRFPSQSEASVQAHCDATHPAGRLIRLLSTHMQSLALDLSPGPLRIQQMLDGQVVQAKALDMAGAAHKAAASAGVLDKGAGQGGRGGQACVTHRAAGAGRRGAGSAAAPPGWAGPGASIWAACRGVLARGPLLRGWYRASFKQASRKKVLQGGGRVGEGWRS